MGTASKKIKDKSCFFHVCPHTRSVIIQMPDKCYQFKQDDFERFVNTAQDVMDNIEHWRPMENDKVDLMTILSSEKAEA